MRALNPEKTCKPVDAKSLAREMEVDVLARTLWGEARGEGTAGMQAVVCVILNRLCVARQKGKFWWGNDLIGICQKPYQFSCWNKNDPNFKAVSAVDAGDLHFVTALRLARRAVIGAMDDITDGATHYHAAGMTPDWARNEKPRAVIGRHIFYRLED